MSEYYLAHHGILGMKWGVRRYQNADGTLTDAGRLRYSDSKGKVRASKETRGAYKNIMKLKKNGASRSELNAANKKYEESRNRDLDADKYRQLKNKYSTDRMTKDELDYYNAHKQAEVYKRMDNQLRAEQRARAIKITAAVTATAAAAIGVAYIHKHPEVLTKLKDKAISSITENVIKKGEAKVQKMVNEAVTKATSAAKDAAKEAPKVVAEGVKNVASDVSSSVQRGIKYGDRSDEQINALHDKAAAYGQKILKQALSDGKTKEEAQQMAKEASARALKKLLSK